MKKLSQSFYSFSRHFDYGSTNLFSCCSRDRLRCTPDQRVYRQSSAIVYTTSLLITCDMAVFNLFTLEIDCSHI